MNSHCGCCERIANASQKLVNTLHAASGLISKRSWLRLLIALINLASPGGASAQPQNAQQDKFLIRLMTRQFTPAPGLEIEVIKSQDQEREGERVHFLLQYEDLPTSTERETIAHDGIRLLAYLNGNTYIASARVSDLDRLRDIVGLRWAGPLSVEDKIASGLKAGKVGQWAQGPEGRVVLTIQFHPDVGLDVATGVIIRHSGEIVASLPSIPSITAAFYPAEVSRIAREDTVQFVDVVAPPLKPVRERR